MQYGICSGRTAWGAGSGTVGGTSGHRRLHLKWLQFTNLGPTMDDTDNGTKCPPVLRNDT